MGHALCSQMPRSQALFLLTPHDLHFVLHLTPVTAARALGITAASQPAGRRKRAGKGQAQPCRALQLAPTDQNSVTWTHLVARVRTGEFCTEEGEEGKDAGKLAVMSGHLRTERSQCGITVPRLSCLRGARLFTHFSS